MKAFVSWILTNLYAIFYESRFMTLKFSRDICIEEFKLINSKKICIFAIYEGSLNHSIQKTFEELIRNKYQVIVVNSKKMNKPLLDYIASHANVLIQINNNGKDFGKYKAGYQYMLQKKLKNVTSLLLINDSFFFLSNAHSFWNRVDSLKTDVVTIIKSEFPVTHLQSYFILFKNKSFMNNKIKDFFVNYKNYNARYYQIKYGELGLSRVIQRTKLKYSGVINKEKITEIINNSEFNNILPKFVKQFLIYQTNYSHSFYKQVIHDFDIPILKKDILKVSMEEFSNIKIILNNLNISKAYTREIINTLKSKNKLNKERKSYTLNQLLIKINAI